MCKRPRPISNGMTIKDLLVTAQDILTSVIPFIVGLAVFVVLWGIFNYIVHGAEEEKRAEGKKFMIFGIIGIFMMLSIWGFVNVLVKTFDLDTELKLDQIPQVPMLPITP